MEKMAKETESAAPKKKEHAKKDLKTKDYYTYKLVGVVVHNGNAESGHYYSYINVARHEWENNEKYLHTEQDRWVEFNDSLVREFSFQRLEAECFGGGQEDVYAGDVGDATGEFATFLAGRSKSAYMLIYEKREKMPIPEKETAYQAVENDLVLNSLECDSTAVSRAENSTSPQRIFFKDKQEKMYRLHKFHNVPQKLAEDITTVFRRSLTKK